MSWSDTLKREALKWVRGEDIWDGFDGSEEWRRGSAALPCFLAIGFVRLVELQGLFHLFDKIDLAVFLRNRDSCLRGGDGLVKSTGFGICGGQGAERDRLLSTRREYGFHQLTATIEHGAGTLVNGSR